MKPLIPNPEDARRCDELAAEYEELVHAMQSGVAYSMEHDNSHTPKHLRVGVNSAMVSNQALVKLLVDKGLITLVEYYEALRDAMKAEVELYEQELTAKWGTKVTLK